MLRLEDETLYGFGGEAIIDEVDVGDNIVVPYKSGNGKQFWLLFCDKAKHIMTKTFTDTYKNTYYEGDEVVCWCWYDLLRSRSRTYFFNDDAQPTYIYSHLVYATKFIMPPTSHNVRGNYLTFELPNDIL
jgi:hypothetical protein